MRKTLTPTSTQKILPWTKTTICPLRLLNPLWIPPSLLLQSHQRRKDQQLHTLGQPFSTLNSNTFFPRNTLTQYLLLPKQTHTSNTGLHTSNTALTGSKLCHKFTNPVTLPLPNTIPSTFLIISSLHPVAGIEFFLACLVRTCLLHLLHYFVHIPSR